MSSSAPSYSQEKAQKAQEVAAQSQAKYGTYGVQSPLGTLSMVQNPDGTYSKSYGMNTADTMRTGLIQSALGGLSLNPTKVENAYYAAATRQLMPEFSKAQSDLQSNLAARGITEGSEQYDRALNNLRQTQQGTLSDIANQSVSQGQNYLGAQIGNIGALAGQRDILNVNQLGGSTGAQFQETYTPAYQAKLQKAAGKNAMISQIGQLAGTLGGAALMGPWGASLGGAAGAAATGGK